MADDQAFAAIAKAFCQQCCVAPNMLSNMLDAARHFPSFQILPVRFFLGESTVFPF
jgi:hypothetical protein